MTFGTSNLCHDDLEVIVSDETVDGSFERHMTWNLVRLVREMKI